MDRNTIEAQSCVDWAQLKKDLTGQNTHHKLTALRFYLELEEVACCSFERRKLQVMHYLQGMVKQGLIYPLHSDLDLYVTPGWVRKIFIKEHSERTAP